MAVLNIHQACMNVRTRWEMFLRIEIRSTQVLMRGIFRVRCSAHKRITKHANAGSTQAQAIQMSRLNRMRVCAFIAIWCNSFSSPTFTKQTIVLARHFLLSPVIRIKCERRRCIPTPCFLCSKTKTASMCFARIQGLLAQTKRIAMVRLKNLKQRARQVRQQGCYAYLTWGKWLLRQVLSTTASSSILRNLSMQRAIMKSMHATLSPCNKKRNTSLMVHLVK